MPNNPKTQSRTSLVTHEGSIPERYAACKDTMRRLRYILDTEAGEDIVVRATQIMAEYYELKGQTDA